MDLTILFKACVKTVRTTNKSLGMKDKSNILNSIQKDTHLIRPKEIIKQINNMHQFFQENMAAYLNVIKYLSTSKTMTEFDREQVDTMAQKIIQTCTSMISEYKQELSKEKFSKQKQDHYTSVIESVENYLKNISKIYIDAKAVRVKRVIEMHKLSKLEVKTPISGKEKSASLEESDNKTEHKVNQNLTPPIENIENELSPEEMQIFEMENAHLYNELNSLSDEVKQMESKVVHIAELQEMFTEKVLQQEKDIERIATTVVTATDDVKDANEQIRQAIQRNAGLRVWVLFFLLVMSFSLLFLDWYND